MECQSQNSLGIGKLGLDPDVLKLEFAEKNNENTRYKIQLETYAVIERLFTHTGMDSNPSTISSISRRTFMPRLMSFYCLRV